MKSETIKNYLKGIFFGLWICAISIFSCDSSKYNIKLITIITILVIIGHLLANYSFRPIKKEEKI